LQLWLPMRERMTWYRWAIAMAAAFGAGCATDPELRAPRSAARVVRDIDGAGAGGTMEVDLAGVDWKRTIEARKLGFVHPDRLRIEPSTFAGEPSLVPSCQLREVRVDRGSHAGRGALIGLGFGAFVVAVALVSGVRPDHTEDVPPVEFAAPFLLGIYGGLGALLGWAIPKGPIVYPVKQPAETDLDEDCR
jgi:hypothetical protein